MRLTSVSLLVALCGLVWLAPLRTRAQESDQLTAEDLDAFCRSTDPQVHNACKFFLLGVAEATTISARGVCLPDNFPESSMELLVRDAIARDLEFYPEDKRSPAIAIVYAAMQQRFPCSPPR